MKRTGITAGKLLLLCVLPCLLLVENGTVKQAVTDGLALCARSVIPALFPFFTAVSFAVGCGFFTLLRQMHIPVSAAVFVLGLLGGYPVGARTVGEMYRRGEVTEIQARSLLLWCNNAGPAFAVSIAGVGVFGAASAGLALYAIHAAAALIVGTALSPRRSAALRMEPSRQAPQRAVPLVLVEAVRGAAESMLSVCGFVVFFFVASRLITALTGMWGPLGGLLELTGGILCLPPTRGGFAWAAGLLGWGGLSVHCQSAAVLEGTPLPDGRYLLSKAMQGVLSAGLAWLCAPLVL